MALGLGGTLWRFWFVRGHYSEGRRWLEEALAMDQRASVEARAMALAGVGKLASVQGDLERATGLYEEGIEPFREQGDKVGLTWCLNNLGLVLYSEGDLRQAVEVTEEAVALTRELEAGADIAVGLSNLGWMALLARHHRAKVSPETSPTAGPPAKVLRTAPLPIKKLPCTLA